MSDIKAMEQLKKNNPSLEEKLDQSIKWSEMNYELSKKINRKLFFLLLNSYLKWLLILIPLVLGIIYLPPILEKIFMQYQGVFSSMSGVGSGLEAISKANTSSGDLNSLIKQIPANKLQEIMKVLGK